MSISQSILSYFNIKLIFKPILQLSSRHCIRTWVGVPMMIFCIFYQEEGGAFLPNCETLGCFFLYKQRLSIHTYYLQLPMNQTRSILLFSLLLALAFSAQVITFSCQSVDTSVCSSGYRYYTKENYETNALNSYYCVPSGSTCVVGSNSFNLQTCKIDYKNTACSTGVCFMSPSKQVCTTSSTCGSASTPNAYNANYNCSACTTTVNCAKCFTVTSNETGSSQYSQTCLGANCTEGLSAATTNVQRCTGGFDALGQKCECCVTTQQVSRFCTSNSPALSSAEVTTWFNKVEGITGFQGKINIIFVVMILFIGALLY